MPQIVVEHLKKTFKVPRRQAGLINSLKSVVIREHTTVQALQGVSFTLDAAEFVGYIGPNGAGKSTTVKVMSGILVPDSGRCEILGRTPWKDRIEHVKRIGVVFGQRTQLWWDVPVVDSFDLLRDIYRIPFHEYAQTRDELIEALGLETLLEVPVRQLSLGQKMRCELAASLLHRPSVLFLDEPTIGLDAVSKLAVRDFIRRTNRERGTTVILTTHDMDDIEALCSRIILIGKGKVLLDGSVTELRNGVAGVRTAQIEFARYPGHLALPLVNIVSQEGDLAEIRYDPRQTSTADLINAIAQQAEIRDFTVESPPIEEIVAAMYKRLEI